MTSSILAGERRWASARRGGMTVLGKVAVPKPLNLPSQRLENHGLDPSVEIVPKGTLGWGSRPSSSGSNAWGPSSVSPNADSGIGSSSQLSGRPSSGSGTRPSTAGSERSQESAPSVWGQNSRPSSASGALNSNQTALAPLRPRSADTRPGSSQLSRFAESSSDNSGAWGPTGASDKLGLAASKNDGFSLSSGDFPTLGSEKDNCGKSIDSKDQGSYARPGSSSSRAASGKGDVSVNADVESGTVNTWKRDDDPQHVEDVVQPDVQKWQAETQPYLNVNIPPQQFDAWRGPPVNPPGVWYRGPPQGPPYGTPLGPGGFPVESFHYYHPQRPVGSANSQAAPASVTGPKGHHPNTRDMHRPHIPDAYLLSGMPLRPGFYPGSMACEGYYGPPMGYCNSNEQHRPVMGMGARPSVYNPYRGENAPDLGNNNARSTSHGSMRRKSGSGQVESGHPDNTRGPTYKVLTKHHTESDGKWLEDRREHGTPANAPYFEKGYHPKASLDKHEWEFEDEKYDTQTGRTLGEDAYSKGYNNHGSHRDSTMAEFPEHREMEKAVVDGSMNKSESAAVSVPQVSRESPASPKDPLLIQKIEVLNSKARTSGRIQEASAKTNSSASEAGNTADKDVSAVNKPLQPPVSGAASTWRRGGRGTQERLDIRGKSFNKQEDAEGRGKNRPLAMEPNPDVSSAILNDNVHGGKQLKLDESAEKSGTNGHGKDGRESVKSMGGVTDGAAQLTKTRDIAKQRAKKLQKDEEDRIREQKEKASANLEELNQGAQMMDVPVVENTFPRNPVQLDQEKPQIGSKNETLSSSFESGNIVVGEFTVLSRDMILATSQNMNLGSTVLFGQPLSLQQDARIAGAADCKTAPWVIEDDSVSRHKRVGFNQKQDSLTEKSVQISPTEAAKHEIDGVRTDVEISDSVFIDPNHHSSLPRNSNVAASSPSHYSKTNRSNKNRHKLDKPSSSALPSAVAKDTTVKSLQESKISETSEMKDTRSVQTHVALPPEQRSSIPSEGVGGKANGQWNSRRLPRQQHPKKMEKLQSNDALIWAPVRTQSRAEVMNGTVNTAVPDVVTATGESDGVLQKDTKGKRVEMERYVPKPVAKELAPQGGSQRSSQSPVNQTASDNVRGTANEAAGSTGESRNVDAKRNNKPSKAHGLWRQKGLVESESGLEPQSGSSSIPNSNKNSDRSSLQPQSFKPDSTYLGEETKAYDEWDTVDNPGTAAPITSAVVNDREVSGRGHRHQPKVQRNVGNTQNLYHRNFNSGDGNRNLSQPRVPNMGQTDKSTALKENQGAGQRTSSQWQPKSQVYSAQSQGENRPSEGHNVVAEHRKVSREDVVQPASDYSRGEHKNTSEGTDAGHQGYRGERQATRNKGRPRSPNLHPDNTLEPSSQVNVDSRHEQQRVPSGFRKNVDRSNRFDCLVDEPHEDPPGSVVQIDRQHDASLNHERRRFDSQYENQAAGQYDNRSRNYEGQRDGISSGGPRYKDRSQGYPRRGGGGNSRGWRGATVHADSGYN